MTYNSKIRWEDGMRLTADTFRQLEDNLSLKQQIAVRAALGAGRRGLLPDTPLKTDGVFVRRDYEIVGLLCTAVLPSGRILSIDRDLTFPIDLPSNEDADYYLSLEFGNDSRQYERDGVPYTEPEVVFALHTASETENGDVMPLKHFYVKDGSLNIDDNYIPPVLIVATDERITDYIKKIADKLTVLANHPNMDNGDCKRALMHYAFSLRSFDAQRQLFELVTLLQEVALALDFYIVQTKGITIDEIPQQVISLNADQRRNVRYTDLAVYLNWLNEYIACQDLIMAKVVIEKPVVDTEAIKKEVHDALYPELLDALYKQLYDQLATKLKDEIPDAIIDKIKTYIEENTHPQLRTELRDDLRDPLYNDLYEALKTLFEDMLSNVEFKHEDTFMPMI